jgi:hypothetical protein
MLRKLTAGMVLFMFLGSQTIATAYAVDNPLYRPNNKMGIHILSDVELPEAAKLVNSNGGDWGYVTIPMQIYDTNYSKWQRFMNNASRLHVIPIIRIATEASAGDTAVWRKPNPEDIMNYANFLGSLNWPTRNKYIIVFNEVNRSDEWGGGVNPQEYAELLSFSYSVFKSKSQDFFIISSGMDNAAPNRGSAYMNEYAYLKAMNDAVPGIFNQVDGIASHSYPNPGFSQPPSATSTTGVNSFSYESQLIKSLSGKDLPVFITETGWSTKSVSDVEISHYYETAFSTIWNNDHVIAVTPFLLQGSSSPFQQFSMLDSSNNPSKEYATLLSMPKNQGDPALPAKVLSANVRIVHTTPSPEPTAASEKSKSAYVASIYSAFSGVFDWIMGK